MSRARVRRTRRPARAVVLAALASAGIAGVAHADPVARPVIGVPAEQPVPFGAELTAGGPRAWAYGQSTAQPALSAGTPLFAAGEPQPRTVLLTTDGQGLWTVAGVPLALDGSAMAGFAPAAGTSGARALAAQMTAAGGGLLVGTDGDTQVLIVRDPGGAFRQIPAPPALPEQPEPVPEPEDDGDPAPPAGGAATTTPATTTPAATTPAATTPATTAPPPPTTTTPSPATAAAVPEPAAALAGALAAGERLYDPRDARLPAAPLDEGGRTGVLIAPAPADGSGADGVLHWNGETWAREPIELPPGVGDLRVSALAASAPEQAWLLASSAAADTPFMLFRRVVADDGPSWQRTGDLSHPLLGRSAGLPAGVTIAAGASGQPLTAAGGAVWVDGTIAVGANRRDLTFFVGADGAVAGTWCDAGGAAAPLCGHPIGRDRTIGEYRSAAWSGGAYGTRVISGYGDGAVLRLQGDRFERVLGIGRTGSTTSIAFAAPDDGWVGGSVVARVAPEPVRDATQAWPVPFRRPLLAVAGEPGKAAGALDAAALAVGDGGQVARFTPGSGWAPEYLLDGNDARATPRLRGVAWPRAEIAFAVGDDGAMWRWRSATRLWEPDPGKPLDFDRHLMGVAFDPADPDRGYAVGKDGALLAYQKSWQEETPPAGLEHAQFTSIAFAGSEALVAYRIVDPDNGDRHVGGLIANDGSGWRIVEQVAALLAQAGRAPLQKVAALPDGGAVAAGRDVVVERDGAGGPWRFSPAPLGGISDVAALAAFREGDSVRAVLSVDPYRFQTELDYARTDEPMTPVPEGAPPFRVAPDPLPTTGFLVRETAGGWRDEQHAAFGFVPGSGPGDAPIRPDSVLALALSPAGDGGWAVGGETGSLIEGEGADTIQTAGVLRYPPAPIAPSGSQATPLTTTAGTATFAIGGGAQCAELCAPLATTAPGPDRWLPAALQRAAGIDGLRGFLYTGGRLADGASTAPAAVRSDEFRRYAALLASSGSLPVFAAASSTDADALGSTAEFGSAFDSFGAPFGAGAPGAGVTPLSRTASGAAQTYYAFQSDGPEGAVRVFVLDYSAARLGDAQLCWLSGGLGEAAAAGVPAVVVGARPLTAAFPGAASDATAVAALLAGGVEPPQCPDATAGRASAYLFALRGENRTATLKAGGGTLPMYGTGSLGYSSFVSVLSLADFSASGFLLASVDVGRRDPATNQAPVSARLIPNVAELALDAEDGVLLRRSEPSLFNALARRPRGGMRVRGAEPPLPDPYVPIPARCLGADCASFIAPEYEFHSSRPDVGDFVRQDPDSPDDHTVLLGADDKPVADRTSGLFCPYNAGTTTVSVRAGGLVYSQTVTVQPGSVRRPCGTVPLIDPPPGRAPEVVPDMPQPEPEPEPRPTAQGGSTPVSLPRAPVPATQPPPVLRPAPPVPPTPLPLVAIAPPFLVQLPNNGFLPPVIQPPAPPAARPSPPSGTSPVSSPVSQTAVAPEEKREEEVATETSHNMAAYRPREHDPFPGYLAGLAVIAALAGVAVRRGRPDDGRETLALGVVRDDDADRRRRHRR